MKTIFQYRYGPPGSLILEDLLAHRQNETDLLHMIELHRSQKVSPVISRLFPLTQTAEAFSHIMDGGVGKVVTPPWVK
jgi:NADPH:quinone reductase-like Zn-dependent oxidoreductase